jgi:hypothetical protein
LSIYSVRKKKTGRDFLKVATGFPVNLVVFSYLLLTPAHGISVALPL